MFVTELAQAKQQVMIPMILPGQNKMSDEDERIQGGNGDFNSAETSFRSSFWTIYSVLVILLLVLV